MNDDGDEGGQGDEKGKSNTIPRVGKKSDEVVSGIESKEGSYDLVSDASGDGMKRKYFFVHFKEVDYVPYLLRRRIDLGEGGGRG